MEVSWKYCPWNHCYLCCFRPIIYFGDPWRPSSFWPLLHICKGWLTILSAFGMSVLFSFLIIIYSTFKIQISQIFFHTFWFGWFFLWIPAGLQVATLITICDLVMFSIINIHLTSLIKIKIDSQGKTYVCIIFLNYLP